MKKVIFTLFTTMLVLITIQCSKEKSKQRISISDENNFSSEEFSNNLSKNPSQIDNDFLISNDFDHYLLFRRQKSFDKNVEEFRTSIYGVSYENPDGVSLDIEHISVQSPSSQISYSFSTPTFHIETNGILNEELPVEYMEALNFTFETSEIVYQGTFPEPGNLTSPDTDVSISSISKSEGHTLYWNSLPEQSGGHIKLFIELRSSESGNNVSEIGILIPDTGSFELDNELLYEFVSNDKVNIELLRETFASNGGLLVRSIEYQYWQAIKITD